MIRKAGIEDLDHILRIEEDSFEEPWSRASIEAEFYKDFAEVYVYECAGVVAGYIILWDTGGEREILTLAVERDYRNMGIGRALVEKALSGGENCSRWFLEAACNNQAALRLYGKTGFSVVGVIKNYYGEGKNAYRMARIPNLTEE